MTSLDALRRFAVTRSLFPPTTLRRAIAALGFVQADPIRAPARAQDLTLRPRVTGYRAGDLERQCARLPIEEDVFINYGFVTRPVHGLMHPRSGLSPNAANKRAAALLAFVRERGTVHPRDVEAHFAHGRVTNYWGGSSSATTQMLELMHYQGVLRVAGRDTGIRLYTARETTAGVTGAQARRARLDALVDVVVHKYAAAGGEPVVCDCAAARRRPALARRGARRAGPGATTTVAGRGRWTDVVLAGGRSNSWRRGT